jgi:hypothetical protein
MTLFSRLPRWLAGAFLLLTIPSCAGQAALAFNCSTIQQWRSQYSDTELRGMALDHGYSEKDIADAERCFTKKPSKPPLEVTKRSPTLPPVHTAPVPVPVPTPAPVEAPAPAPAPVVVQPAVAPIPEPETASWLWDFLKDLGVIVLIGAALGITVRAIRSLWTTYQSTKATQGTTA